MNRHSKQTSEKHTDCSEMDDMGRLVLLIELSCLFRISANKIPLDGRSRLRKFGHLFNT